MPDLWPWIAVAGLGALHGLNPASGWLFAAAWGLRAGRRRQALRALPPIALGHLASVLLVAGAATSGRVLDGSLLPLPLLAVSAIAWAGWQVVHCLGRGRRRLEDRVRPAGRACALPPRHRAAPRLALRRIGLALWSFAMASLHGTGLMLVPALMPVCLGAAGPARSITASGSLMLASMALVVHLAAMLAVTGALALAACSAWRWRARALAVAVQPPR